MRIEISPILMLDGKALFRKIRHIGKKKGSGDLPNPCFRPFYATFGVVVTSSIRVAGVLLVFSYLIVPALAGIAVGGSIRRRLLVGWGFGTLVSVSGCWPPRYSTSRRG